MKIRRATCHPQIRYASVPFLKKRLQFAGAEGLGRSSSGEKTGEEISRVTGGVDKYLLLQHRQYVHQARPTKPAGGQVNSSCA